MLAELHPLLFDSTSAREIDWLASDQVDADVFTATWQQWANQSPEAALSWLQRHPNCERFSHVRDAAVAGWAQADGESALTWAQREPEVIARGHLLACVAVGYAKADPEFAATVVNRLVTSGTSRQHAVEGIAVAWAQSDPASAATWALGITEATAATGPLDLVLYSWFGDDRAAVEKWVRALPEKDKRDAAWSKLVRLQIEKDPAPAAIIAAEIGDSSIRARETANVVRHWAQQDFDLAGEWTLRLPSSPLRTQLVADLAAIAQERPAIP